jgi:hypothetical protein
MPNPRIIDIPASPDTREIATVQSAALVKVEVDAAISTAKQYPRDLDRFSTNAMKLVETVAMQKSTREGGEELFYSLPRGGKVIEGPSVRLAEIIAHTYGNCRVGVRTVAEESDFVVCQGVFHDLEQNVAITFEVKRRIRRRDGTRYDDDMIGVTANAGCGIAYRNAVLKGVPKAFWLPLYEKARKMAGGSEKEAAKNRKAVIDYFGKMGVAEKDVLRVAGVGKLSDIGPDQIATLRGIATAIKDGETTKAAAFGGEEKESRKSQVKESKPDPKAKISKEQISQIYSLAADLALESTEIPKAIKEVGHAGKLADLPASLFAALAENLQKRAH